MVCWEASVTPTTVAGEHRLVGVTADTLPYPGPMAPVLAHQGGWDEILLVAAPLVLLALLLVLANSRARRLSQFDEPEPAPAPRPGADGDTDDARPPNPDHAGDQAREHAAPAGDQPVGERPEDR